jgi:uncharacterized protein (DUF885 family)
MTKATAYLCVGSFCLISLFPRLAASAAPATADATLKALYDAEWAWRVEELGVDPEGGRAQRDRFPRVDPASQQRRLEYWSNALAELRAIPLAQLSDQEKINADVFRAALEAFVADIEFKNYQDAFGFWTWMAPRHGFGSVEEYRAYLDSLRDMPRFVDEQIANMRAGLARGFTRSRISIAGRERTIESLAASNPADSPFNTPFADMPSSIPDAERPGLIGEGQTVIREEVAPAFAKLHDFVRDEYIPNARTTTAAEALPDGKTYYEAKIREYTTLDLSAEEIHRIGLQEVARIDADMKATMKKAGWEGDFQGFLDFLKNDPQFYARTPYELIAKSAYVANKVNGQLKFVIGLLPRYRFTIVPTPAAVAPFGTGGNGGLESCLMNTYNLPARPLYTIPPLTLHECTPGHSFQAALALEGPERPAIRKSTYFSGYGEGWALYMEWLGTKMGIYETPYDEFGRETYEMWRAARLVVDTGLHHMGWTRQQALDYLGSRTALSDHEVTIEVDRYINTPAQALAYKLGELLIRRKRAEAAHRLGADFDQRWFHDLILGLGSVPLPTLERVLDDWIAGGGRNPNAE